MVFYLSMKTIPQAKYPVLSVIIPTKNEAELLPACLLSLANQQTDVPFEVIIIDTNSTDDTIKIAKMYGARIVREPKKGKVYAFCHGADSARGSILCFTEADCLLPTHWITCIAAYFETHNNVGTVCGIYTFRDTNPIQRIATVLGHVIAHALFYLLYWHHSIRASNFAVRKSVYENAGGFSFAYKELYDVELSFRLSKYGTIAVLPTMMIQTSDRRIRGRVLSYIREFVPALLSVMLHRPMNAQTYKDIR